MELICCITGTVTVFSVCTFFRVLYCIVLLCFYCLIDFALLPHGAIINIYIYIIRGGALQHRRPRSLTFTLLHLPSSVKERVASAPRLVVCDSPSDKVLLRHVMPTTGPLELRCSADFLSAVNQSSGNIV